MMRVSGKRRGRDSYLPLPRPSLLLQASRQRVAFARVEAESLTPWAATGREEEGEGTRSSGRRRATASTKLAAMDGRGAGGHCYRRTGAMRICVYEVACDVCSRDETEARPLGTVDATAMSGREARSRDEERGGWMRVWYADVFFLFPWTLIPLPKASSHGPRGLDASSG